MTRTLYWGLMLFSFAVITGFGLWYLLAFPSLVGHRWWFYPVGVGHLALAGGLLLFAVVVYRNGWEPEDP